MHDLIFIGLAAAFYAAGAWALLALRRL